MSLPKLDVVLAACRATMPEELVRMLGSEDPTTRAAAAAEISRRRIPEGARQIVQSALIEREVGVKIAFVNALSRFNKSDATKWLASLLVACDDELTVYYAIRRLRYRNAKSASWIVALFIKDQRLSVVFEALLFMYDQSLSEPSADTALLRLRALVENAEEDWASQNKGPGGFFLGKSFVEKALLAIQAKRALPPSFDA